MSQISLLLASVATGVFFSAWPLRMNQSGLPGTAAMLVYASVSIVAAFVAMTVSPGSWAALRGRPLLVGVQAGLLNAAGVLLFTFMLARATRLEAPRLLLIVVITQTALSGLWAAYQVGSAEPRLVAGLVTALLTVWLLR
ncbi:MAG: hypothetical protein FJW27_02835 [Acidimicrobiia bacterium]|nr:hypothetical protein [Acidimicrobiia bacterium]